MSKTLLKGLSGYALVRDAIKGDYPIAECARSMLPVCDEVLVVDCHSTDGTLQMLAEMAATNDKFRVISLPWPELPTYEQFKADVPRPMNDAMFWPKLINIARPHLRYEMQMHLDADEILYECAHDEIRKCVAEQSVRYLRRVNFWRDARSLIPEGWVCGTNVARVGPTVLWMPSDEMHPEGEPEMRVRATKHDSLLIAHVGFLRTQAGFFAKSKVAQPGIVGNYDTRLEEAERTGQNWWEVSTFPGDLVPYDGGHPEIIVPWLKERGRL